MRLYELLEDNSNIPRIKKSITGILSNPNIQHLGTGYQAIAYTHKKFPNSVIKTINIKGEDDPAYQFILTCKDHPENPFFPKIYTVKHYDTAESTQYQRDLLYADIDKEDIPPQTQKEHLIVVMEKLYPLRGDNEELSLRLLKQVGILPTDLTNLEQSGLGKIDTPFRAMNRLFKTPDTRRKLFHQSRNVQFKQALQILEPLFVKYDSDIHFNNMMLRHSLQGPQLVFLDPVKYK
jgi:hypothetical protein